MTIITTALSATGINLKQLTFLQSSLMEARTTFRETLAIALRKDFQPLVPLVAHFDGKILPYADGTRFKCLPIVVSGLVIEIRNP